MSQEEMLGLYGFILLIAAYFIPALVAGVRKHVNVGAISMLNLLLGWTVIGWVAAMVWACTGQEKKTVHA